MKVDHSHFKDQLKFYGWRSGRRRNWLDHWHVFLPFFQVGLPNLDFPKMFSQESFPNIKELLPLRSSKAKTDKNALKWGRVMANTYRTSKKWGPNLGDARPHLIPYLIIDNLLYSRVSQKNQKSEFCYATNPSGFHRLDEPPEKISAL